MKSSDESFGYLRIHEGPNGVAVRLATVVRYLMQLHEMPRAEVVNLCIVPLLQSETPVPLFILEPDSKAVSVESSVWFDTDTGEQVQAGILMRHENGQIQRRPLARRIGIGTDAAAAWLRSKWGHPQTNDDLMDRRTSVGSRLAVSSASAVDHWCYAHPEQVEVSAPARLKRARNSALRKSGAEWTIEQRRKLERDVTALSKQGWPKARIFSSLSPEYGIGPAGLAKQFKIARAAGSTITEFWRSGKKGSN
ncbi:MAG: hypothetical protein EOP24_29885 [Hyphomicrobiales bacterium]|nr:MAG: hypothetical protein EOP24_29885 [Hyphomicrobiales bacterium]